MIREVDLKSFLPEFLGEYREIGEILSAEDSEIQVMENAVERTRDCAFISYCNDNDIGRFERMMNVFPAAVDTLEERRARILIRWNESLPYTLSTLREKLMIICGKGNFSINVKYDAYRLELTVTLTRAGQGDELERLLKRLIPANMVIDIKNSMSAEPSAGLFIGGALSTSTFFVVGE